MNVNIIEITKTRNFTSLHVMWIALAVFFGVLGIYYWEIVKPNIFLNILLLASGITPIGTNIYGNYEYFPDNYLVRYQSSLEADHIELESQKLYFESIEKIEININDWHGKKIVHNLRPFGSGPKLSKGINNTIKLTTKDSEPIVLQIQLESKEHFHELADWIKKLYRSKIVIVEKYDHSASFGLEHLRYREIQEFKEKYRG